MEASEFKKFSFVTIKTPNALGIAALIALMGVVVFFGANQILEGKLEITPATFALLFVICSLAPGLIVAGLVRHFKLKWAYLMVFINQLVLVAVTLLSSMSSRITLFDGLVLWTTITYTLWMFWLSGLGSVKIGFKSLMISFIQPVFIWILVILSIDMGTIDLIVPLAMLAIGIAVSTVVILFTEHLFSLVFTNISAMGELSKFMKGVRGDQASLSIGHNIDALVQYIRFRAGGKDNVIVAPWLHSGPLRGVGGGNLSTQCIEKLNKEHGDSYFLHVPSNHEYNPSVDVSGRVVRAIENLHYEPFMVSKVISSEEGGITIFGQRLNDVYMITVSSTHIDDYDISIFSALRDKYEGKHVLFIDSHPNFPLKKCINVEAFTHHAELIEKLVGEVMRGLEKGHMSAASVGTAMQFFEDYSIFALVIRAAETTLYFAVDANGLSPTEMEKVHAIAKSLGIDRVLFYTTDTHSLTVKALMHRPDLPRGVMESAITRALKDLKSAAEFAYGEGLLNDVRILGKNYYELTTVVKIMARVMPVLFALLFLFLAVTLWIF